VKSVDAWDAPRIKSLKVFMAQRQKKLAILCAGGPAPGLNSVIAAATIRAELSDIEVVGIQDGFRWLMEGDIKHVSNLTIKDVSRIHFRGGSYIGISRSNPTKSDKHLDAVLLSLLKLGVDKLITIGGDGSAWSAWRLSDRARGQLRVAHVPKTIDNDIDLPADIDTFGYQTARHVGVEIVKNLMVDAKTTHRWYLVVTQGRKAGHLALGIGKAAGATLTLIPEEFPSEHVSLSTLVDTIVGSILKRLAYDRDDGLAVLAEGLIEKLHPDEIAKLPGVERDQHGGLKYAEINFGDIIKQHVVERLASHGLKVGVVAKSIGYELRCADPIPYDMEYTRDLGYGAARYLIADGASAMMSMQAGHFKPVPFSDIIDKESGRTRVRMVDIQSDRYQIARSYMVRLRREDLEDAHQLAHLAALTGMTTEAFREQYGYVALDSAGT
jgi:ATP-dependent phosphofructokinase / diphosphate-dependent phosphofructokinase